MKTLLLLLLPLLISVSLYENLTLDAYAAHGEDRHVRNNITDGDGFRFYIVNAADNGLTPASNTMFVGETIEYAHGIKNTGTEPITNITVHTTLHDKETDFRQGVIQTGNQFRIIGDCAIDGVDIVCQIPDLSPGESFPSPGSYHYLTTTIEEGLVFNVAHLCGDAVNGTTFCTSDRAAVNVISLDIPNWLVTTVYPDGHVDTYVMNEADSSIAIGARDVGGAITNREPTSRPITNTILEFYNIREAHRVADLGEPPIIHHDDIPKILEWVVEVRERMDWIDTHIGYLQTALDEKDARIAELELQLEEPQITPEIQEKLDLLEILRDLLN